jgi:AcrR family transcriptional regulator
MASSRKRKKRNRPLARSKIIATALRLSDRKGAEALSMRSLAAELGVEAMSLYHHVPSKAMLLEGVADSLWTEVELASAGRRGDWRAKLRRVARACRGVALRHPRTFALLLGRPRVAAMTADAELAPRVLRSFWAFVTGALAIELGAGENRHAKADYEFGIELVIAGADRLRRARRRR